MTNLKEYINLELISDTMGSSGKTHSEARLQSLPQLISTVSPVSQGSRTVWSHEKEKRLMQKYLDKLFPCSFKCIIL